MASANPSSGGRRERRRHEIHERIIAAATRLFGRKGFADTTALEIADAADVAEKTFYNHFPTKQQLIEEIARRSLAVTAQLLADVRALPGTTIDRLRYFCERSADEAEQSREFTREVVREVLRMAYVPDVASGHHGHVTQAIHEFFGQGLAQGNAAHARDTGLLTEIGAAAYLGIVINWVTLPRYPLRERLRQLADIAEELLATRSALPSDEERR